MMVLALCLLMLAWVGTAHAGTAKKSLVVAGGCFWCVEAVFDRLEGVESVTSGYTGGKKANPTYGDICTGQTGHAEAVKITYDPQKINAKDLLRIFFTTHDPTTLNHQGNDYGTQYRSAIFYADEAEKKQALEVMKEVSEAKLYRNALVTTLEPLKEFYVAESYHQNYFERYEKASPAERSKMNAGYCAAIIEPKVRHFREKYAKKLKKGG